VFPNSVTSDPARPSWPAHVGSLGLRSLLTRDGTLILATFLLTLTCNLTVERVPVHGGFGWDGVLYGAWARDFYHEIVVTRVDAYYVQRILPAAVVHYSLRLLTVPRSDAAILRTFGLYAVALLTLAAWAWCCIARKLELSPAGKWLGFVGLFVNYIALKYVHYVPAGTEATAYTLGLFMLSSYLYDRRVGLALLTLLGAFAWPAAIYVGALLLIFPHVDAASGLPASPPRIVPFCVATAITVVAGVGIWIATGAPPTVENVFVEPEYIQPYRPALLLSLLVSLTYLGLGSFPLLNSSRLYDLRWLLSKRHLLSAGSVIAAMLAVATVQRQLSRPAAFAPTIVLLRQTAYASVARPGIFLVAHVAFYGPMFLVTIFLWKKTCRHLHEAGTGLALAVLLGLLLSLNSQSRYVINIFPLMLPFVIKATDTLGWGAAPYTLITCSSVALSKIWFTINTGPFQGRLYEFPDQGLFMTHGPWISPTMYALQGGCFLVLAAVLCRVCFSRSGLAGKSVS
jgi:hypothetical protein